MTSRKRSEHAISSSWPKSGPEKKKSGPRPSRTSPRSPSTPQSSEKKTHQTKTSTNAQKNLELAKSSTEANETAALLDQAVQGFTHYFDHPVAFVEDFLKAKPEPYQADILEAIAEYPAVAVRSGHGPGKTATEAWADLWFLAIRPMSKVPTTAPTFEKQVRDVFWAEIHRWVRGSALEGSFTLSQTRMAVRDYEEEWFSAGISASQPENLEGFHAPYLLYIIDEAKGVSDGIFDAIQGALTEEAKLLLLSTPGSRHGYFYKVFTKLRSTWKTFHIPCLGRWENGKAIPSNTPICPRISRAWVRTRKAEWGEDSSIYQARVLGEFPDEGEDTLIPLSWIEAAQIGPGKAYEGKRRALGVDVARYGKNLTVFSLIEGAKLLHVRQRRRQSLTQTAGEAKRLAREWKADVVAVDDTGVGGGVTDILREAGVSVLPILLGASSSEPEYYANLKADLFWGLRKAFEEGEISLSEEGLPRKDLELLVGQLSAMKYEHRQGGQIRIVDPDEVSGASFSGPKKSPDHVHPFGVSPDFRSGEARPPVRHRNPLQ